MNLKSLMIGAMLAVLTPTTLRAPTISGITLNTTSVPRFEKLEITFQVSTTANLYLPYDPSPPPGIPSAVGITINAEFTPDNWATVCTQPAFYYQDFDYQVKGSSEWMYPKGFAWKVRFAPDRIGTWQFRLRATDASGTTVSLPQTFTVIASSNPGFVRVSRDPRYFEFTNGTYAPMLGYNMNYNQIDWTNPIVNNTSNFQTMGQNGIQLVRLWLSQWNIWGSSWGPWYGIRNDYDGYLPRAGLCTLCLTPPETVLVLSYNTDNQGNYFDACRFIGAFQPPLAVKRNTNYHIRIHYAGFDIAGPRDATYPNYGLVGKVQNPDDGNWHTQCYNGGAPQNGVPVTAHGHNTAGWAWLEGDWNSGARDFMPLFYLAAENVNPSPWIAIDDVEITDPTGVNIFRKSSMDYLAYYGQRNSYAFDQVVDLAHQYGIYLRPVVMEKNEQIENEIGYDGAHTDFNNDNFYGDYQTVTAVRWYQQAWWRYLQARWGYSTNIQSWELLNEGDPNNTHHFTLADEFAKYMHQFLSDNHLVSTSTWNIAPASSFWSNPAYPNVDFMDIHQYIPKGTDPTEFYDTALATYNPSMWYGATQGGGALKPTIRGETGLTDSGTEPATNDVFADPQAVWLHNFIWGTINPGGMIESYWYANVHIYSNTFDHRSEFGNFYRFIATVPLNNGNYQNAEALTSDPNLRAWGQKDLIHGQAHLWIANAQHTWQAVVNNTAVPPITGTVTLSGLTTNKMYQVQWWDTSQGIVVHTDQIWSNAIGDLSLNISNLVGDVAVKIFSSQAFPPLVQTP